MSCSARLAFSSLVMYGFFIFNGCRQCRRPQNRKEDGGRETRTVALHRKKLNP